MVSLLTVSDVSAVLEALGVPLTPRQIRYAGLPCTRRGWGPTGGRLFSPLDVCVIAVYAHLVGRCRAVGLPLWSARAAVRYRDAEIRRALTRRESSWLALDPVRGTVALVGQRPADRMALDLRQWGRRVGAAVSAFRETYPEVWTGTAYAHAEDLADAVM